MRTNVAFGFGVLSLVVLIGATIADVGSRDPARTLAALQQELPNPEVENPAAGDVAEEPVAQPRTKKPARRNETSRRARGIFVRPDGTMVGRVSSIEPGTLNLLPAPNSVVTLIQNRRIVGQALTNQEGVFEIPNVTHWGIYSVFVAHRDWVMMVAAVARPDDHAELRNPVRRPATPASNAGVSNQVGGLVNELVFRPGKGASEVLLTALQETQPGTEEPPPAGAPGDPPADDMDDTMDDGEKEDYMDYEFLELQVLPREDFISALQSGALGPTGGTQGGGGGGGATGGTGGGGGGGGGGDLGGGGLLGAGVAAGIGAALAADKDDDQVQSPFQ